MSMLARIAARGGEVRGMPAAAHRRREQRREPQTVRIGVLDDGEAAVTQLGGAERLLVVDDEATVRELLSATLRFAGF